MLQPYKHVRLFVLFVNRIKIKSLIRSRIITKCLPFCRKSFVFLNRPHDTEFSVIFYCYCLLLSILLKRQANVDLKKTLIYLSLHKKYTKSFTLYKLLVFYICTFLISNMQKQQTTLKNSLLVRKKYNHHGLII